MDLLYFFYDQFKVPIIGVVVFGLLMWLMVFVRPIRRVPSQHQEKVEDSGE